MFDASHRALRRWSAIWAGVFLALQTLPLIVLLAIYADRETVFLGMSACLNAAVLLLAWRTANGRVRRFWWLALILGMAVVWFLAIATAYAGPGETDVCWPRYEKFSRYDPPRSIGPDPWCSGEDVTQ